MEFHSSVTSEQGSAKRPRSPTGDNPLPAAKVLRTSGQLQINYLARQHKETIPLVTVKLQLPEILRLIGEYDGVLQRHESMAGNLGACPLGPILLKRFERLFDGPPRILKSHARDANVSWLDVVEFARNKPEQFNLEKTRNGIRVCQFYTKQCRIEISEEDFVLIASGMPEKLIPPQPIPEDEQKELGVLDLLDRNLGQVIQLADQVSARARQLTHKMKNRRAAILARRESESEARRGPVRSNEPPLSPLEAVNGTSSRPTGSVEPAQSPSIGFTPVNAIQSLGEADHSPLGVAATPAQGSEGLFPRSSPGNVTYINGRSVKGASATERAEMMKQFMSASELDGATTTDQVRRQSLGAVRQGLAPAALEGRSRTDSLEMMASSALKQTLSTVAIPNTPASLMPQVKANVPDRDDGGPFKIEMVQRMESMERGERVIPPCDRCRRLHMDCLKNLTACMGCTKKHAKCSWKDVKQEELRESEQKTDRQEQQQPPSQPQQHQKQKQQQQQQQQPHVEGQWDSGHLSPASPRTKVPTAGRAGEGSLSPDTAAAATVTPGHVIVPVTPPDESRPDPNNSSLPKADVAKSAASASSSVASAAAAVTATAAPVSASSTSTLTQTPTLPSTSTTKTDIENGSNNYNRPTTPRFDVRPPPLNQGPTIHENRRSPAHGQAPASASYAKEPSGSKQQTEDDNDEGDRLEALARSTYRSYSQSARSPEH